MRHASLWVSALAVGLVAGSLVGALMLLRPNPPWTPPASAPAATRPGGPITPTLRPLSDYAVIWQRDLRQVIIPLPTVAAPAPAPESLPIKLVGTAVEANQAHAIFSLASGTLLVRGKGSVVEGYRLLEIQRGKVLLRGGQREFELRVPWYDRIARAEGGP